MRRAKAAGWLVCSLLVLMGGAGRATAQVVDDGGAWLALFADGTIDSDHTDRLKWWFDGQVRFFDDADGYGQTLLRPGVGYRLGETATAWAGYAWINTAPAGVPNFDENRLWQQLTWSDNLDGTTIGYRSRLEQRFLETGSDTGWRFRQLIAARRPLPGTEKFTLVAWDEIFFHLNDTDWGADAGFDQNRVFVGLGFKRTPDSPVRIEVGYLNQFVHRTNRDDLSNHLLSINLFWHP